MEYRFNFERHYPIVDMMARYRVPWRQWGRALSQIGLEAAEVNVTPLSPFAQVSWVFAGRLMDHGGKKGGVRASEITGLRSGMGHGGILLPQLCADEISYRCLFKCLDEWRSLGYASTFRSD